MGFLRRMWAQIKLPKTMTTGIFEQEFMQGKVTQFLAAKKTGYNDKLYHIEDVNIHEGCIDQTSTGDGVHSRIHGVFNAQIQANCSLPVIIKNTYGKDVHYMTVEVRKQRKDLIPKGKDVIENGPKAFTFADVVAEFKNYERLMLRDPMPEGRRAYNRDPKNYYLKYSKE